MFLLGFCRVLVSFELLVTITEVLVVSNQVHWCADMWRIDKQLVINELILRYQSLLQNGLKIRYLGRHLALVVTVDVRDISEYLKVLIVILISI